MNRRLAQTLSGVAGVPQQSCWSACIALQRSHCVAGEPRTQSVHFCASWTYVQAHARQTPYCSTHVHIDPNSTLISQFRFILLCPQRNEHVGLHGEKHWNQGFRMFELISCFLPWVIGNASSYIEGSFNGDFITYSGPIQAVGEQLPRSILQSDWQALRWRDLT